MRVKDIAIVKDAFEPEKVRSRMNGKSAISFLIYKKETADIIRTVDKIKAFVEKKQSSPARGREIFNTPMMSPTMYETG